MALKQKNKSIEAEDVCAPRRTHKGERNKAGARSGVRKACTPRRSLAFCLGEEKRLVSAGIENGGTKKEQEGVGKRVSRRAQRERQKACVREKNVSKRASAASSERSRTSIV